MSMFKRKRNPVAKQLSNPMNKPRTEKPKKGTGYYRRKSKYPNDRLELDIYYATDFGRKM
jgi:stalled ribosome alternative rescue factor ArfA